MKRADSLGASVGAGRAQAGMQEGVQNRASRSGCHCTSCVPGTALGPGVELRKQTVHNPVVSLKGMLCCYVDL